MNPNIVNIIVLLQMALGLLSNPQVQTNPVMLKQANTFATLAIQMAEDEVAIEAAAVSTTPQTAPDVVVPAPQTVTVAPVDEWVPNNQYMVSNQFALDPNTRVLATTSFEFTIAGRLVQLETDSALQTPNKWFSVVGEPLTITYGDQSQTGITDSDGNVTLPFHAIGIPGEHQFAYSSPLHTITDVGMVNEQ